MRIRWQQLLPAVALVAIAAVGSLAVAAGLASAQATPSPTPVATVSLVPSTPGATSAPALATPARPPSSSVTAPAGPAAPAPAGAAPPAAPGSVEITQADNGKTFHVTVGQTVIVRLGTDLDWTVTVAPQGILPLAPGVNTLVRGVQGIYRAAQPGSVTVSAEGRPHCNPGQACAQFIVSVQATVVVDGPAGSGSAGATGPTGAQQPSAPASTAPGAATSRPAAGVALPNTGTGRARDTSPAWGIIALGVLLLSGALMGAGLIAWKARPRGSD